jgi:hypothetical protein
VGYCSEHKSKWFTWVDLNDYWERGYTKAEIEAKWRSNERFLADFVNVGGYSP